MFEKTWTKSILIVVTVLIVGTRFFRPRRLRYWVLIPLFFIAPALGSSLEATISELGYNVQSDFEPVEFSPHIDPKYLPTRRIRAVLKPENELDIFQKVEILSCYVRHDSKDWDCAVESKWRINIPNKVYMTGDETVTDWIDSNPKSALTPYLDLLLSLEARDPKDAGGSHPSSIRIRHQQERSLVYRRFALPCEREIKILAHRQGTQLRLSLQPGDGIRSCLTF